MKDLISVIIPTYNREKTILRSVNSVLNQTYKNIEIIIIDDASSDNTNHIIKKIKDNRIKYYKLKENKGACYARNFGIKKANGKYITFQDSDDEYYEEKIEKQYNNLILNNSDFDYCKLKICDNDNIWEFPDVDRIQEIEKNGVFNELCRGNFISTQAIFVRSEILKKIEFDEQLPRLQDYDLLLRMIPDLKVSFTNECLANLYRQKDSISNNPIKLEKTIDLMLKKEYSMSIEQLKNLYLYFSMLKDNYGVNRCELNKYKEENDVLLIQLNEYQSKYNNLCIENKRIIEENEILKTKNEELLNSNSWKITRPLRAVSGMIKKIVIKMKQ